MDDYLYKEEIIEHFKDPQNFGTLAVYDASSHQLNPFCGDEIEMFVKFADDAIYDIKFTGKGCAISISATSILTEYAKDRKKDELTNFSEGDMLTLLGIDVSETRKKCALLGLSVLQDCIRNIKDQKSNSKNI